MRIFKFKVIVQHEDESMTKLEERKQLQDEIREILQERLFSHAYSFEYTIEVE
jgi:hypothetical protein